MAIQTRVHWVPATPRANVTSFGGNGSFFCSGFGPCANAVAQRVKNKTPAHAAEEKSVGKRLYPFATIHHLTLLYIFQKAYVRGPTSAMPTIKYRKTFNITDRAIHLFAF